MNPWDVVVVGSGPCGLTIAHRLQDAGRSVLVVDKGARPGGRVASRPIEGVLLNNAAESMRVDDPAVAAEIAHRTGFPVPGTWIFPEPAGALAARWAAGISVHRMQVTHLAFEKPGLTSLRSPEGAVSARAVVLTAPVPQSVAILSSSGVESALPQVSYEKRLVLLGAVEGMITAGPVESPILEKVRRRSTGLEVIAHAEWSSRAWHDDEAVAHSALLGEVERIFPGARVFATQLKRWRYANAVETVPGVGFARAAHPLLYLAGDGFGNPGSSMTGIARAVGSGMAVAAAVLADLHTGSGISESE